ncbi:MAG TPA: serine hydrolase [Pyrinomonadaceae bacterium]|jgi:CubicO group peptidase (beta-lactamase class C family)
MRNPLKTAALTVLTAACLTLQAAAQVKPQPAASSLKTNVKKEELAARLEKLIPQLMADGGVPGLSVLLIHDNKVFWQHSFGVTNVETKQPVTADTVFEAASLSKPVFAYGVLKLADAGKLDLDTPLVKYLPGAYVESDERLNQITARIVLSHRTGFPNWRRGDKLTINFTPGERFSYSGEGFVYLQKVVERLTGGPLDAFMRKTVFGPLGMTSSSYVWQAAYESRKAYGHDPFGSITGRRKPAEANAAASLHTTLEDYAKFVTAVMTGAGLKKKSAREMLTPYVKVQEGCTDCVSNPTNGPLSQAVSWGLGWGLQHTSDGDSFWHWGDSNNDAQAYVVAFPKRKLALMVFANSGNGHSIFPRIIEAAVGGEQPAVSWINYDPYDSPFRVFARDILARGEAAVNEYRERKKAGALPLTEVQMNRLGYALLSKKMLDAAIEVFKLNVEAFPDSWNVYDSLGEAYVLKGEKELGIKNYQKSVELNPKNEGGIEALRKLKGMQN